MRINTCKMWGTNLFIGLCLLHTAIANSILCPYDGLLYPATDDCHAFLKCENGQPKKIPCNPPTYNYNCEKHKCENITHCCGKKPTPTTKTTITQTPVTNTPTTVKDTTNAPTCTKNGEKFPYKGDCKSYSQCNNGKLDKRTCPFGLSYNCITKSCNILSFTPCCKNDTSSGIGNNCLINGIKVPNPFTCNKYFECADHKIVQNTCPKGQRYHWFQAKCIDAAPGECDAETSPTTNTPETTSEPTETHCEKEGSTIPAVRDCRSYYKCENGKFKKHTCQEGQVWNCFSQACGPKCFSPCCKDDPNPPNNSNSSNCLLPGIKIPNPFTCDKYFVCHGFHITEKTCPAGKTYDWLWMKCVKATTGKCAPTITEPTSPTGKPTGITSNPTGNPSGNQSNPTGEPSGNPSNPTGEPSGNPSNTTGEPSGNTSNPTGEPSGNPSNPTEKPTGNPSHPTEEPTGNPSHPTGEPSGNPSNPTEESTGNPSHPTGEPSGNPSIPTGEPSGNPSNPTKEPTGNPSHPTGEPSGNPSIPTGEPSGDPSIPTEEPTGNPSHPTGEPSGNPSNPTKEPTGNPSHPTGEPSGNPSIPTGEPSGNPSNPTEKPTGNPSHPTEEPSGNPSIPTGEPTGNPSHPTGEPSGNPSIPTGEPSGNPSIPTEEPTGKPSHPTGEPSGNPSIPTGEPSGNPSIPTEEPTGNPSHPTGEPSGNPSNPTEKPTGNPSHPTGEPSGNPSIPTEEPTGNPSHPTGEPSGNPSNPTEKPTSNPSHATGEPSGNTSIPTGEPTGNSSHPTGEPSGNPSISTGEPSGNPSIPTEEPTGNPSHPTGEPSGNPSIPTGEPSENPSNPTEEPTGNPGHPTGEPSGNPSIPTGEPTGNPSHPTGEPSGNPSIPTGEPSGNPSIPTKEPTGNPSHPTGEPSGNPSNPTEEPTGYPSHPTGEPSGNPSIPTGEPSGNPSNPTEEPTGNPSHPTGEPSGNSSNPTEEPTGNPSIPTGEPCSHTNCEKEGATIPDVNDCRSYYKCENGKLIKHKCSNNMVWNCFHQTCSPKCFSPCCKDDPNPPPNSNSSDCILSGIKIPNPFTCDKYFECSNRKIEEKQCPEGNRYDWILMKCVEAETGQCAPTPEPTTLPPGTCRKGDKIADPEDSHSYYECNDNGQLVHNKCMFGMTYNCWLKLCTPLGTSHCSKNNNNETGQELSCFSLGGKIPDPYNCTNYYQCESFKTIYKSCADSQYFDAFSLSCVEKNKATCILDLSEHTTATVEPPVTQQPSKYCPQSGTKIPDSKDCTSYSECDSDRQLTHKTCPSGEVWNCISQSCTDTIFSPCCQDDPHKSNYNSSSYCFINGWSIPNFFTCDKYYTCKDHVIEEHTCRKGERYDWLLAKCVKATSGNCATLPETTDPTGTGPTITEDTTVTGDTSSPCEKEGATTPAVNDCRSYYKCQKGKLVKQKCPQDQVWNCFLQTCSPRYFSPCCKDDPNPPQNGNSSDCILSGIKIPNPFTCDKYFECSNRKIEEKQCPEGNRYDWILMKCVEAETGQCAPTPEPTTLSPGTCRKGDKIADPEDSHSYYECNDNGQLVHNKCMFGMTYNCWLKLCTPLGTSHCSKNNNNETGQELSCFSLGGKIPDPYNCTNYYQCESFKTIYKSCADSQYFDAFSLSCVEKNKATCILDLSEHTTATVEPPVTQQPSKYCPQSGTKIPDSKDCTSYSECDSDRQLTHKTCPSGEVWNCISQSCTDTIFSPCCQDDPHKSNYNSSSYCFINGWSIPNFFTCDKYYTCKDHVIEEHTCRKGERYDWLLAKCVKATSGNCATLPETTDPTGTGPTITEDTTVTGDTSSPCEKEGATTPAVNDCRSYYKCQKGKLVKQKCPQDQVWNCFLQTCSPRYFSPCCKDDPNPPQNGNSSDCILSGIKIPNPFTCDKYFECSNRKIEEKQCPEGNRYDWILMKCVEAETGQCAPTPEPTTLSPGTCRKGDKIADPEDSHSYYECNDNGQLVHNKCMFGMTYNCWLKLCTPLGTSHCSKNNNNETGQELSCFSLGGKIPDPYNCTNYYQCESFKTIYKSCADSQYFDALSLSCVEKNKATCILDLSEHTPATDEPPVTQQPSKYCPQSGTKIPDSKDCTSYSECDSDRQLTHKTCPSGEVWNCISQSCTDKIFSPCCQDDPHNSNYSSSSFCFINGWSIPNFFRCDKYYTCKDHVIEEHTCQKGERYDWLLAKCVKATSGNCASLPENNTTEPTATEPTVTDSIPTVTDSKPTVTDSTPTVTDSTPTVTDSKPTVTDSTPTVTDSKPTVTDSTPTVTDSTPTVTDSKPTVTDSTPTVTDSKPTVTDSKPTVTDSKPTVTDSKPTSAPHTLAPITCHRGQQIADPDDNHSYYECDQNGHLVHTTCFAGLYYECWIQICGPKQVLARAPYCSKETNGNTGQPLSCTQLGSKIPDPYNCGTYYECDYFGMELKTKRQSCPSGQSFDAISNSCKNKNEAVCIGDLSKHVTSATEKPPVTKPPVTQPPKYTTKPTATIPTVTNSKPTVTDSKPTPAPHTLAPITCHRGQQIADPDDNHSYYECDQNGHLVHTKCFAGLYYECWIRICGPKQILARAPYCSKETNGNTGQPLSCTQLGSKIPDPYNCGTYYECDYFGMELKTKRQSCPSGQSFDAISNSCKNKNEAVCIGDLSKHVTSATVKPPDTKPPVTQPPKYTTKPNTSKPPTKETTTSSSTITTKPTTKKPNSPLCPIDGLLYPSSIPGDCGAYMKCIGGQPKRIACPAATPTYNCEKKACEYQKEPHCCASKG